MKDMLLAFKNFLELMEFYLNKLNLLKEILDSVFYQIKD